MEQVLLTLTPQQAADEQQIKKAVANSLHLPSQSIYSWRIVKRSVDARQRVPKILLTVQAFTDENEQLLPPYEAPIYQDVHHAKQSVHIIGAGPAGLFAALTLLEHGIKPIVFERGKDVSSRKRDIASLNKNEGINAESNYCFGEGGAGTFSDGKLFSRSKKRGNMQRVMELFHHFGANDSVLYEAHAHIGSDKLPSIIRNMRECIIAHGGEIHFSTCVKQLDLSVPTILAIGHSAHDTYRMLDASGVLLHPKGFALGVRVEHPQALIDNLMYHGSKLRQQGLLPAACYSLVAQVPNILYNGRERAHGNANKERSTTLQSASTQNNANEGELQRYAYQQKPTRGVYSFCMCPGGHIVPAGSEAHSGIVNGMSASHRNSPYANSGIVVELHPEDLLSLHNRNTSSYEGKISSTEESNAATGATQISNKVNAIQWLEFQEMVERLSWEHGAKAAGLPDSAIAPAQRLRDFVEGKQSKNLPHMSYLPGAISSRLDKWLPAIIGKSLQQGFRAFDKKYPGFLTNDAVILGVESRSSSPIRIPRDPDTFQAYPTSVISHEDTASNTAQLLPLYPCGEGAGYAGGITSSALDGINAALAICRQQGKNEY